MTWWCDFEKYLHEDNNKQIMILLENISIKNTCDRDGNNLLHYISRTKKCHETVTSFLIESGCDVKAVNNFGQTPLQLIFESHQITEIIDINLVKLLIEAGSDVNSTISSDETILHYCVKNNLDKLTELLLKAGAKPNLPNKVDQTPLFMAVYNNNFELATLLIEAGSDVNWPDNNGRTCLFHAFKSSFPDMVQLLLESGAEVNKTDFQKETPLYYGLFARSNSLLDDFHATPIIYNYELFINSNYFDKLAEEIECIKLLIKYNADVNFFHEMTPLDLVLRSHHSKITQLLLHNGAIFDYDAKWDNDAIYQSHNINSVRELLRYTAQFQIQGRTDGPLNFSVEKLEIKGFKSFYTSCIYELKILKKYPLYGSAKFYNLLLDENIDCYIRNKNIIQRFKESCVTERFPIYGGLIYKRVSKALKKEKLRNDAKKSLGKILNWNENSMHLILENICQYLKENDLLVLTAV